MAEEHALVYAAGLAAAGLRPVVAIYSTFMQRAVDQAFQEVSLQNAPVLFCLDRAGLCGSDGAVHHGFGDIAFFRVLPNMVLISPADQTELRGALALAGTLHAPVVIRYPRDEAPENLAHTDAPFELGKAVQIREGDDAAFLALGAMVEHAVAAAESISSSTGLECSVYSARFAKPLDEQLIADLIRSGKPVLTVEDHSAAGGFGSAVLELAAHLGLNASNVQVLGLPDHFIAHATRQEQLAQVGLDASGLARAAAEAIARVIPADLAPRRNGAVR
jgi:1-deoxy-D-xylulose-5-phosphate synthase